MHNNKFRQTVVAPCDQATWLLGQASGAHSTLLHKKIVPTEYRAGERKSRGEEGELRVNGPDLYYKKERGR